MTTSVLRQIAAWCLHYPDDELYRHLPLLRDAARELAPRPEVAALHEFLGYLGAADQAEAAAHYVEVFDTKARRCLYLTWYTDGDTRRRGEALLQLKQTYRVHGMEPAGDELPDYLPTLLEFAATCPGGATAAARQLLAWFRPGVELLAANLARFGTPYTAVVAAALGTFPAAIARPPEHPPLELVGIDPYPRPVTSGGRR
ncbi:nitrate reductase molybdenum cofactor assembly chaperone [Amycolatopsis sp. cmx-11-12]|uniref:nitrate reductase molybdenum cofactor assembly chaperone n=1 Tax=Amycolatopsis sp. cmx-11-12 TaxID=2785795 RepID=UPI00391856B3